MAQIEATAVGLDVQLRDEQGKILEQVEDRTEALSNACDARLASTRLLRYLDPYGDAVFNKTQAPDLARDLEQLLADHPGTPLAATLARLRPLVARLAADSHLYLWFVGD